MSGRRRRVHRIEVGLTPCQAAVLWLQEAHEFASMEAYAEWLTAQPDASFPLFRLHDMVVPAVAQAMKGAAREARERAVLAALRDVEFLFFIHQRANARILSDWRALHLEVTMLTLQPSVAGRATTRNRNEIGGRKWWRENAENTLLELCALGETMRVLAETYFGGNSVLFPRAAEALASWREKAEVLIDKRNENIRFAGPRGSRARLKDEPIDVDAIKVLALEAAKPLVAEIVALAKSEVYTMMGDREAASDAVVNLVVRAASANDHDWEV